MGFQLFIARGNLDLAVAVVVGAAFGAITTSLVGDMLTPPLGYLSDGVDFKALVLRLNDAIARYGAFLNTLVKFLTVAFAMFVVLRAVTAVQNLRCRETEDRGDRRGVAARGRPHQNSRPVDRRKVLRPTAAVTLPP